MFIDIKGHNLVKIKSQICHKNVKNKSFMLQQKTKSCRRFIMKNVTVIIDGKAGSCGKGFIC